VKMLRLDVGCGAKPKDKVNVDLFLYKTLHRAKLVDLKTVNIPNFISSDVHHLPFRNDVFDVVFCHQLLEHKGIRYIAVVKELLRVSRNKVDIEVPSQLCRSIQSPAHDKIFTKHTFETVFRNFVKKIKYTRRRWKYVNMLINRLHALTRRIPIFVPCPIPTAIKIDVWKSIDQR